MIPAGSFSDWFHEASMVPKSTFIAAFCTVLAVGGTAMADEYRPSEFLGLDLSMAVLSPKRLGPDAEFAPVRIEARTDPGIEALARAVPAAGPKITFASTSIADAVAEPKPPVRTRLARRHSNPLDAQASDTRIQTWPCRSGGICNWQR
jgi:hypothetical protein